MQSFGRLPALVGTYSILILSRLLSVVPERRKQDSSVTFCPGQCRFLVLRPLLGCVANLWRSWYPIALSERKRG